MGIFIILIIADVYIWWRLLTDLWHRNRAVRVITVATKSSVTVALLYLVIRITAWKGEFADPENIYLYLVFGVVAGLIITAGSLYLLLSIITRLLGRMVHHWLDGLVLANLILAGLLGAVFADAFLRQRFDLKINRKEVFVNGLDDRLDGFRIVFVSDLHLSSYYRHYNRLEEAVRTVIAEKPDLLINGGDFISYGWREYGMCDTILRKATARYGAFAVAGNHDDGSYYPGNDESYRAECAAILREKIASSGYTTLDDTLCLIDCDGAPVAVAGVVTHGHHLNMRYGDFSKALSSVPDSVFSILLLHDPGGWDNCLAAGFAPDLTLSGHTHGMQIGLPVPGGYISPASLIHRYWRGLYTVGDASLLVSTGLGTMGMAARIFMPPEINVIIVRKKPVPEN